MRLNTYRKFPLLILAAFVGVFVFGCILISMDASMAMAADSVNSHSAATGQKSHSPENDHMAVTLGLPSDTQGAVSFSILLALVAIAFRLVLQSNILQPEFARLRLLSRREIFSEHDKLIALFRTGILNPKIY